MEDFPIDLNSLIKRDFPFVIQFAGPPCDNVFGKTYETLAVAASTKMKAIGEFLSQLADLLPEDGGQLAHRYLPRIQYTGTDTAPEWTVKARFVLITNDEMSAVRKKAAA